MYNVFYVYFMYIQLLEYPIPARPAAAASQKQSRKESGMYHRSGGVKTTGKNS